MSVVEDQTYYAPDYPLNLDLRPWDTEEWGKFDGFIYECQLNIDKRPYFNKLQPCEFRWFAKAGDKLIDYCPRCGLKAGSTILNGEFLLVK